MTDPAHLEQAFKEAVAGLPNYKRLAAHHYVVHLRAELVRKDREISELADRVIDLENRNVELAGRLNEHEFYPQEESSDA